MTPRKKLAAEQFRSDLVALGLSRAGAALLLGVSDKSISRWVDAQQPVPRAHAIVVRLMVEHKVSAKRASKLAGYDHDAAEFIDGRDWGRKFE